MGVTLKCESVLQSIFQPATSERSELDLPGCLHARPVDCETHKDLRLLSSVPKHVPTAPNIFQVYNFQNNRVAKQLQHLTYCLGAIFKKWRLYCSAWVLICLKNSVNSILMVVSDKMFLLGRDKNSAAQVLNLI